MIDLQLRYALILRPIFLFLAFSLVFLHLLEIELIDLDGLILIEIPLSGVIL